MLLIAFMIAASAAPLRLRLIFMHAPQLIAACVLRLRRATIFICAGVTSATNLHVSNVECSLIIMGEHVKSMLRLSQREEVMLLIEVFGVGCAVLEQCSVRSAEWE
jgi:tetrahydromethanopterin S-methyltransferase subunit D